MHGWFQRLNRYGWRVVAFLLLALAFMPSADAQAPPVAVAPLPSAGAGDSGGSQDGGDARGGDGAWRDAGGRADEGRGETDGNSESGANPRLSDDAVIQYDPDTDSIIVITDDETNDQISKVIDTMDRAIPQVLIKVLFLEVTHTNGLDLGVESTFTFDTGGGDTEHELSTNFGVPDPRGGFYRILDDDLQATLHALATVGKLEVLSRPSVLARNNEPANITIGQRVPFVTNTRITDNGDTINTITYEDIGIILDVTPRINSERQVEMEVATEISTLTGDTVPISEELDARVIATRSAETMAVVDDGKTVVIGGLMEDNITETVSKVPLLGDIPYLGAFFRRTQTDKSKTELLIFLTPYVVGGAEQLEARSVAEHNQAELPPNVFTPSQQQKFLDNLGKGMEAWERKK